MLGALIGGFVFLIFFAIAIGILLLAFWLWMLIDCLKRDFKKDVEKIVWVIVIVFLHIIGAIIYYFVVKISDKKVLKNKR
jgi:hypothetical protein